MLTENRTQNDYAPREYRTGTALRAFYAYERCLSLRSRLVQKWNACQIDTAQAEEVNARIEALGDEADELFTEIIDCYVDEPEARAALLACILLRHTSEGQSADEGIEFALRRMLEGTLEHVQAADLRSRITSVIAQSGVTSKPADAGFEAKSPRP